MPLESKVIEVTSKKGEKLTYTIREMSCYEGREVALQYPLSVIPKVGEYNLNEELSQKLMKHVSVDVDGKTIMLVTKALVDNHVPDWETGIKLEMAMMEYNTSFFKAGEILNSSKGFAKTFLQWATSIVMDSLVQSFRQVKQASENSKQNTV